MSGGKSLQASVSFTLPLSCQICLGKVKEPVTCSNQHVFCSTCMNIWLERNSRCPTCRVEITSQSPLRKIIGGTLQNPEQSSSDRATSRELRRARFELVAKEYEDEILHLESKLGLYEKENQSLKKMLENNHHSRMTDSSIASSSFDSLESEACARCANVKDIDTMLSLTKKLQEATKTYSKMKQELSEVKQMNASLIKRNDDLIHENKRVREEVETRSPMKFGRLTVATLETRLQSAEKLVARLKKALERSDVYTEQLEAELKNYKMESNTLSRTENNDNSSLLISSLNEQNDILSHAINSSITFDGSSCKTSELVAPYQTSNDLVHPQSVSLANLDETSKASSCIELQSFENTLKDFVAQNSSSDMSYDTKLSFSRKLKFESSSEEMASSSQSTEHNFLSIEDSGEFGIDLSSDLHDFSQNSQLMTSQSTLNSVNFSHSGDDSGHSQPRAPSAMKTTIDAGGSRITTSQLSAEEHDIFSRPSSAPSRTFLLSGSRFSALRPLEPQGEEHEFQPVKCISPMHLSKQVTKEPESSRPSSPVLRLVSPDDVINTQWRRPEGLRPEEDLRTRDVLSRVNILKKKTNFTKAPQSPMTSSSPLTESRRKQKFSHKRSGSIELQSVLKSPKCESSFYGSEFR